MKRSPSVRHPLALAVSLGVLTAACNPTTPELPSGETGLSTLLQASYGSDLGKAAGAPVAVGSTVLKTNDLTPDCHDPSVVHTAPDVSYTWTAPYTDAFTITTAGSTFDTILGVRTYPASTPVGCNDDASASTQQSSLTLNLTGGSTYIITVDGDGSSAGSFQLHIDSVSCPGACQPPQNGCYGPFSSCNTSTGQCSYTYYGTEWSCDDNNPLTTNDHCDGFGNCSGTAPACNTPPGPCYEATGSFDPSTGQCGYPPKAAGASCSDGNACSANDVCDGAGSCSGAAVCPPPGPCQSLSCVNGRCLYADIPCGPPPPGEP